MSTPSAPSNGGPITVFWASRPCGPTGWLAMLLIKAGDVENNPGPTTTRKQVWIYDICRRQKQVRKQISIRCHRIEHWVHIRCAGIRLAQYTDTWTCHQHRSSRLTIHTDITLSVIAKTLEKSLLPYITANTPNTPMQHGYKTQHSTVTALHTLNNTVAKGFNQMAPPARTITVALDMSKVFDTINIHTLVRKLLQKNIPGTIIKLIANYIKGRKAYTIYRNHTSKQRQFKTGVPQGGVHPHYLTFTPQTYHHPVHRFRSWPTQTTSQSHSHTQVRVQPRNTYNHTYIKFLPGQNKITFY